MSFGSEDLCVFVVTCNHSRGRRVYTHGSDTKFWTVLVLYAVKNRTKALKQR
jgi:hypothetical protein